MIPIWSELLEVKQPSILPSYLWHMAGHSRQVSILTRVKTMTSDQGPRTWQSESYIAIRKIRVVETSIVPWKKGEPPHYTQPRRAPDISRYEDKSHATTSGRTQMTRLKTI